MQPFDDSGFSDFLSEIDPRASEEYERKKREQERIRELQEATNIRRGMDAPTNTLGRVVDILSRGNYASAKFYNTMFNEEGNLLAKAWRGFTGGLQEAINPEERLTFRDVIAEANPLWAASNPWKTSMLGFMGDIVIDPINAVSFGTGGVIKSAVRMTGRTGKLIPLGKPGVQIFREIVDEGVESGLERGVAKQRATQAMQEIIDPTTDFTAPEITRYERKVRAGRTRANVIRAFENNAMPPESGIFLMPQSRVGDLFKKGKLFDQNIDPTSLGKLPEDMQLAVRKGSPRIEVDVLENFRYVGGKSMVYGAKKKDRLVAVLVPKKYIVEETAKKVGGPSKRWASTLLDPKDIRFVTDDSDMIFDLAGLRRHSNIRNLNRADEVAQIKAAQRTGQAALQRRNLTATDLIDPGGLKILGKSVVTSDQFKHLFNSIGASTAMKAVKDLPGVKELQIVARGLQRTFGLQGIIEKQFPEWMRFRRMLEVRKHDALQGLEAAYVKVFKTDGPSGRVLNEKERNEITGFLGEVTTKLKEELQTIGGKRPTPQLEGRIFQEMMDASKLTMDQKAAVIKLRQAYNDFDLLEQEAGIVKGYFLGYHPARHEAITRAARYRDTRKWQMERLQTPVKKTDTFTQKKVLDPTEEAIVPEGFKPIEDAGRLYLMRFMEHNAAIRKNEWEGFIKRTYGKDVPEAINQDLVRLGEKFYQPNYGDAGRLAHQFFHDINRIFRASATIIRPAFAVKQVFGNLSQIFVEMGRDAMKVVDPTTLSDAVRFVSHGRINMDIRTPFGVPMKAAEVEAAIRRNPVLKNLSIEGLGLVHEHQAIKRLTNDLFTKYHTPGFKTPVETGMRKLFTKSFNYLNYPALVEDTFRVGTFIGALKAGHSEAAAMEIVDRALFNYTTGLSRWEQSIRNGVIPFYTFQKFGLTLLGKAMGTAPGRVAAMPKIGKAFYETWNKIASGEQLTDNERKVVPGYLLDQPNVFEQFRKVDGRLEAIFRTFNSMTLLDVVNMIQLDDKGEVDYGETLTKGGLAQLAPFWKVPLETLVFKRELFSDKALDGVYAGKLGDVDFDKLITNVTASAGLSLTVATGMTPQIGIGGGIAGGIVGKLAAMGPAEEVIKWLIGWEESVNPRTQKREVYVSPYRLQVAKSIMPGLNTAIKLSREDETMWDGILYAAFGVGVTHLDLKQEGRNKAKSFRFDYHDKVRAYRKYMQQGRIDRADMARQDLRELLDYNAGEVQNWLDPTIRGGTIPEEDF